MTNGPRKTTQLAERRRKVAQFYLRKLTQEEIAERLSIDQSTVSRDLAYLRKEWAAEAIEDTDEVRGLELAELREMERDCAVFFVQSKDIQWIRERRHIKERVSKLLGLDAPIKQDVTTGGVPLQPVQYIEIVRPDDSSD